MVLAIVLLPLLLSFHGLQRCYCLQQLGSLSVAPLALGTLNHFDDGVSNKILQKAPSATLIDTAQVYGDGNAESILGKALAETGREDLFVATKFSPQLWPRDNLVNRVVESCRKSVESCGRDAIDLYQIHYADAVVLQNPRAFGLPMKDQDEEYWQGLLECCKQGLARNVGVCNYGPTMIRRAYSYLKDRGFSLASNQINYNLMRRSASDETKQVCDELGIRVLAYHPLGKGALAGKYDASGRSTMPSEMGRYYRVKNHLRGTVELRRTLESVASHRRKSMAQVAINWVTCKGAMPICGARDGGQAVENMGATGWSLTNDEVAELDEASEQCLERYSILGKEFTLV